MTAIKSYGPALSPLSASMGGVFSHAAIEINRLDAEGEREAAGVWREVLKRLNALTERSAAAT